MKRNILAVSSVIGLVLVAVAGFLTGAVIDEAVRGGQCAYSKFKLAPLFGVIGGLTGSILGTAVVKTILRIRGVFIVFTTVLGTYIGCFIFLFLLRSGSYKCGFLVVILLFFLTTLFFSWIGAQIPKIKDNSKMEDTKDEK